jgi:hypothetical protein
MADLEINYEKLHGLATSSRKLKDYLDDKVPGLNDGLRGIVTSSSQVGNAALQGKLNKFHLAWDKPFKDAMSNLDDLAKLLDSVATKFFDMDADFAAKASNHLASMRNNNWVAQKAAYDHYLATKDKQFTYSYLDEHGNVVTKSKPLFDYSDPATVPHDPGPRPTSSSLGDVKTDSGYDDQGRVTSETTTTSSSNGLNYTETTTYTYTGDSKEPSGYTTKITHSDGTVETITKSTNTDGTSTVVDVTPDGTSTSTVTPKPQVDHRDTGYTSKTTDGKGEVTTTDVTNNPSGQADVKVEDGPDGKKTFSGDAETGFWTQTSGPGMDDYNGTKKK